MSSQKLRKLGEQMKLQADQEVKKGISKYKLWFQFKVELYYLNFSIKFLKLTNMIPDNPDVRGSLTGILDTLLASMSALVTKKGHQ